jgi:phosphate transport system substrate-binding protein
VVRSQPVHVPAKPTETDPVKQAATAAAAATADTQARLGSIPQALTSAEEGGTNQSTGITGTVAKAATHLAEDATKVTGAALTGGAAVVGTGAAAARSFMDSARAYLGKGQTTGGPAELVTEAATESRIILVPHSANSAYAYWEVNEAQRTELRHQGGRSLKLRIHDATNLNIDQQPAHSTQEYTCSESDQDMHVPIPVTDRDYIAELGYLTEDGRWLSLIRSFHVHVPSK